MKKKIMLKSFIFLALLGMIFQAALAAENITSTKTETTTTSTTTTTTEETQVVISQEVQDQIKASDPDHFERNLANYQDLLIRLDVHERFQQEIERLVMDGHALPDLLIAYEFLYQQFGHIEELASLVTEKEAGQAWEAIFTTYNEHHPAFIPSAFDPDELEKLMQTPGISTDDIMIGDRVSFVSGNPFQTLIEAKMEGSAWKEINAQAGILYSSPQLPRVQVTAEQLEKYTGTLTEQQVVEAFVLADKLAQDPEAVMEQFKNGASEEAIFAASYLAKYQ